jgi:uncharacterized protein YdhG (YjbR/CyaY superfamily)
MRKRAVAINIDAYIASAAPEVRAILKRIRKTIREAAPQAEEIISYRMPAFKDGRILIYFAAFQNHIGLFPPVRGDMTLIRAAAPFAGEKGNLKFPLGKPIPYGLIKRIVKHRVRAQKSKASPTLRY